MRRAVNRNMEAGAQFFHASDMVGVMVGDEDRNGGEIKLSQCLDHRTGITRVDNGGRSAGVVVLATVQQPDVIVPKGRDGMHFIHLLMLTAADCEVNHG